MEKKIINAEVDVRGYFDGDVRLSEIKENIDSLIEHYGKNAKITIDDDPYDGASMNLCYDRVETDSEYEIRLGASSSGSRGNKRRKEQEEYQEFLRTKSAIVIQKILIDK